MANTKDKETEKYSTVMKIEIQTKTKNIEANVISCLWQNPQLYLDYDRLDINKFKNNIWKFYYTTGKKLAMKSIKKIEEIDVDLFLENQQKLQELYSSFGGYDTINDLKEVCNVENVDVYIQELIKWDVIWNVIDKFTVNNSILGKLSGLDADGVYNYYNSLLNDSFVKKETDYIADSLGNDLERVIKEANEGLNQGLPIDSNMLSEEIGGLQIGAMYLVGGASGTGKSTWLIDCVTPSLFRNNESAVFILNEQSIDKFRQQFLTYIINNIVINDPSKKFNSKRWLQGGFTEEEMDWLGQAIKILGEKEAGKKIIIIELKTYTRKGVERIIKKYATGLNVKYFFLDTLKLDDTASASEQSWLSMMNDAKAYSNLIKPSNLNVHLTMTMQLQKINKAIRYLDNSLIGMSKSIIDTASTVIMFRRLLQDEYGGMAKEIKIKTPIQGTSSYQEVPLYPDKHYQIMFITKNRQGASEEYQIVSQQELGTLEYEEVGLCWLSPS